MHARRLLSLIVVSLVASACGSGPSESRNIALSSTTRVTPSQPVTLFRSNGDGTADSCVDSGVSVDGCAGVSLRKLNNDLTRRKFARFALTPAVVTPPRAVFDEIARISNVAGAASVIARLPVAFSPAEVGIAHRAGFKTTDDAWKGSNIAHMSSDPTIAAATIAVGKRLAEFPGYSSRSTDVGLLYGAHQKDAKPTATSRKVSSSGMFAQVGVVPFVRMLVTASETQTLLSEGLIAGAEVEAVTTLHDTESSSLVGVSSWTVRENANGWWEPALSNPPAGVGTVVSISDTGIASGHPAFGSRVISGGCFGAVDPDCGPSTTWGVASGSPCTGPSDCDHGTHVAGIAAGAATTLSDGTEVPVGMAPSARILSYRTCINTGRTRANCLESNVASAMGRAATLIAAGTNVVSHNMSHGLVTSSLMTTQIAVLAAADVIVVQANGNGGGTDECGGGDLPGLYVVANMRKDYKPALSTDFSATCTDLWAPGSGILAASFDPANPTTPTAVTKSGTSMAAPHVAGAAALVDEALRRVADPATPPSLTGSFDRWAGISDPTRLIADSRDTCAVPSVGQTSCTGSGADKPLLSLTNLVHLLEPDSERSFYTTERLRAEQERAYNDAITAGTPSSWTRNARPTSFTGDAGFPNGRGAVFWLPFAQRFKQSATYTSTTPYLYRTYVVVENGTLSRYTVDGQVKRGTLTARGPRACTTRGWLEVWSVPTALNNQKVAFELAGPSFGAASPTGLIVNVLADMKAAGSAPSSRDIAVVVDPRPLAVDAPVNRAEIALRTLPIPAPLPNSTLYRFDAVVHRSELPSPFTSTRMSLSPLTPKNPDEVISLWEALEPRGLLDSSQNFIPVNLDFERGSAATHRCFDVLMTIAQQR